MGDGNIQLNLWFQSEGQLQKFDAALAVSAEVFGNHTMKLERKKASPPTPHPASVFASDYNRNPDSPEQRAKSDSGAGATVASGMRKRLENQRVAVTSEMTYKNMRIIPVALLQDNRKLTKNPKWDKNGNKVKQSGNNDPKVGQEWKQSGNKVGTRTLKWAKNGNKVGTRNPKWDKNGNKNPKVGPEWKQSGNRVGTRIAKWDKYGKWDKNGNQVGTRTPN